MPRAWLLALEVPDLAAGLVPSAPRAAQPEKPGSRAARAVTRFRLTLAYDGTDFEGWQSQARARPVRTVQGVLEAALGPPRRR